MLHGISPTAVPVGGAEIAVGGSRLKQVHSVSFGTTVVHEVTHVSSTRLTVRAPAHALGRVAVTLHSASGPSRTAHLSYVRAPTPLHWHADPGIDPHRGELTALSCVTENFCVAVERDPHTPTRLLRFGTHIAPKITKVPESAGVRTVGCGTNHFCVAGPASGAYIWNGARWRGPIRLGGKNLHYGPVCARGTSTCLYYSSSRTVVHTRSGWARVLLPASLHVNDISCGSANFCEALGSAPDLTRHFARYNGSNWQLDHSAPSTGFVRVACASRTYCLATGEGAGSAEFDGTSWTQHAGNPKFFPNDLACGAQGHCLAVGRNLGAAAILSGGQWTSAGLPDEWAATAGITAGTSVASCPSARLCRVADLQGRTFDLVNETWSAGRQLVPATGHLLDLSCASRVWCMAIDQNGNALRWHAGHWSEPQPIDKNHGLVALSCAPDRTCTAVTTELAPYPGFQQRGQAIRYVNGHWQHRALIDPTQPATDISCPSAGDCRVVDRRGRVITFGHNSWSPPGAPIFQADVRRAIDCVAAAYCVTVGRGGTLVLNGTTWRHVPGPPLESRIDCVDAAFCVAGEGMVAELRDGVLGRLSFDDSFLGPSCASRSFCIGAGHARDDSPADETFNGSAVRFSRPHHAKAVSCTPGPVCVELTNSSALVGRR